MTDFKVGDRVRVEFPRDSAWSGEGVLDLIDQDAMNEGWYYRVDFNRDHNCVGYFRASDLTPLHCAPYEPRDGDEITISLRGKVSGPVAGGWDLTSDGVNFWQQDFDDYEVTVHERGPEPKPKLPTTPGSVIRGLLAPGSDLYMLSSRDRWVNESGADFSHRDFDNDYEVIFDAGAE